MVEHAAVMLGPESKFASLATASGFTVRECMLAAKTGRLAAIVAIAERRSRGRRRALESLPPIPGHLTGREALDHLRARRP